MNFENNIEEIRDHCYIAKYENIKQDCMDKNIIMKITDILMNHKLAKEINLQKIEEKKINTNILERLSSIDTIIFKRPWSNLPEIHKVMKINEYIEMLKYKYNLDDIDHIKDKLLEDVKDKKLNSKGKLTYDSINGQIIFIKDLKIDEEKCTISYK